MSTKYVGWIKTAELKVGDLINTWFSDKYDGFSTILEIRPYQHKTGYRQKYADIFTHIIKVSAPRTKKGWIEFSAEPVFFGYGE